MTSFLTLPNELLQHIAHRLPFSALVSLQCVNRRLHNVCKDRLIFQTMARHGHKNIPGAMASILNTYSASNRTDLDPKQLDWCEGDLFLDNANLELASKIAYTVERCSAAVLAPLAGDEWTLHIAQGHDTYNVSAWLPPLLALNHPITLALEPNMFIRLHIAASRRGQSITESETLPTHVTTAAYGERTSDLINVSFIINYVTLQRLGTTLDPAETIRVFEDFFFPLATTEKGTTRTPDGDLRILVAFNRLSELVPKYGEQHNPFTLPQASGTLVLLIFGLAVQALAVADRGHLPKPKMIPFHNLMDINSIFDTPAASFSTCHLDEMTSPEFLSGQWMGYYSDQRGSNRLTALFDPPMRDINIVTRPLSPQDVTARGARTKIDRQTRGIDSHGEFLLEGRVYANGNVDIAKCYLAGNTSWVWTGHVTPFGIVGHWGDQWEFGGYFWIFKEEWC